jgi:hypothetical protein
MTARIVFAAAIAFALSASPSFAQGTQTPNHRPAGINAREHRQVLRIKDGVKDGDLTRGELDRLRANEAAIRAEERVYRQSGDGLTPAERRDLERDLNRTSSEIYRAKHNNRDR